MIAQAAARRLCLSAFIFSLIAVGTLLSAGDLHAQQNVADFYKGKQMKFIIRSEPGGGYDLVSRLVASHITRHIPGNPSMIPVNMPGGGGLLAANYMYEIAPRDGTHLTLLGEALPMDYTLGFTPALKADLGKFNWIGTVSTSNTLTYLWHSSPTKTIEDAKKRETVIGATGAGSTPSWLPIIYNNVFGTKFKVINGYKSAGDVKLAMERGEVEGYGANPWVSLNATSPELVRDKKFNIIVQVGAQKEKDLPDVPLFSELKADTAEGQAVVAFVSQSLSIGRAIATTQDAPADRLVALRKAFNETMADPLFLADAKKVDVDVNPVDDVALTKLMDSLFATPADIKAKVKAALPSR
jgi:tripartite-type tricarboxylate transporter receptor subunit TctC